MNQQQMRELAERLSQLAESRRMDFDEPSIAMMLDELSSALTSAADELEARDAFDALRSIGVVQ